jgi:hypothetical protein
MNKFLASNQARVWLSGTAIHYKLLKENLSVPLACHIGVGNGCKTRQTSGSRSAFCTATSRFHHPGVSEDVSVHPYTTLLTITLLFTGQRMVYFPMHR